MLLRPARPAAIIGGEQYIAALLTMRLVPCMPQQSGMTAMQVLLPYHRRVTLAL